MTKLSVVLAALIITGCASVKSHSAADFNPTSLQTICIINNPKVIINGFEETIAKSFMRYNVNAMTSSNKSDVSNCPITLQYTALRSWDVTPYLSYAELNLYKNNQIISYAIFELSANGGLDPSKWNSNETKVNLMVDKIMKSSK